MDDALLDLGLGKYCFNCLWKTGQSIHTRNQYIFYTPVFQAIQDGEPELGTFILTNIHSEDILTSFHIDPNRNVNSTFYNPPLITGMEMDRIHKYNSIHTF